VKPGRPPLPPERQRRIHKLLEQGFAKAAIAKILGLSRLTVIRVAKRPPPPPHATRPPQ